MLCDIYIVCTCNLEENKCTLYMCFCVYSVITAYIVFVFNQERLIVSVFLAGLTVLKFCTDNNVKYSIFFPVYLHQITKRTF
jgi:hypothetical protein